MCVRVSSMNSRGPEGPSWLFHSPARPSSLSDEGAGLLKMLADFVINHSRFLWGSCKGSWSGAPRRRRSSRSLGLGVRSHRVQDVGDHSAVDAYQHPGDLVRGLLQVGRRRPEEERHGRQRGARPSSSSPAGTRPCRRGPRMALWQRRRLVCARRGAAAVQYVVQAAPCLRDIGTVSRLSVFSPAAASEASEAAERLQRAFEQPRAASGGHNGVLGAAEPFSPRGMTVIGQHQLHLSAVGSKMK